MRKKNSGSVQQLRWNTCTSTNPIKHNGSTHEHLHFAYFFLSFFPSFFLSLLFTYLLSYFAYFTYLDTYLLHGAESFSRS